MIKVSVEEESRILTIQADGMISEADIDGAMNTLEERYPELGVRIAGSAKRRFAILLDWERLEGWEMGAKTVGTLTGKMLTDIVGRVAIVADERWRDEEERISDIGKKEGEVRFFPVAGRLDALAWLRGD